MKIKDKRKAGEILEREGIASRIIIIANEISQGGFKEAMNGAGRIAELVESASFDTYWTEKAEIGRHLENDLFLGLIEGDIELEAAIKHVRPREA